MPLHGIIFDLDGTLVDSALDFDAIRRDLGLPPKSPILEAVEEMCPGDEKDRCLAILHDHEHRGAQRATLMPGVREFLTALDERNVKSALLTRNSRFSTELTLRRLRLEFEHVVTREDAPPKPDPAGLLHICKKWNCRPAETVYFGDFLFDIQAGRNAGMRTALFVSNEPPDYAHLADHTFRSFSEALVLLEP